MTSGASRRLERARVGYGAEARETVSSRRGDCCSSGSGAAASPSRPSSSHAEERETILRIHLGLRRQDATRFDLGHLATASEGFSGAELEQAVV